MKMTFREKDLAGGKYLPVGKFTVRVVNVKTQPAKSTGNDVLVVEVRGVGPGVEGKEGTEYLSLEPKAMWKIGALAEACGIPREYLTGGEFDTEDLVGKTFDLEKQEMGSKVFEGKERKSYRTIYHRASISEDQLGGGLDQSMDYLPF